MYRLIWAIHEPYMRHTWGIHEACIIRCITFTMANIGLRTQVNSAEAIGQDSYKHDPTIHFDGWWLYLYLYFQQWASRITSSSITSPSITSPNITSPAIGFEHCSHQSVCSPFVLMLLNMTSLHAFHLYSFNVPAENVIQISGQGIHSFGGNTNTNTYECWYHFKVSQQLNYQFSEELYWVLKRRKGNLEYNILHNTLLYHQIQ